MKSSDCLLLLFLISFSLQSAKSQFATCTRGETCKPFNDCDELRKLTQNRRPSPEEVNLIRNKQCNSINRVAYVCCPSAGISSTSTRTQSLLPKPPVCGFAAPDRIFGGEATGIDEFPWIAQIQYLKPGNVIRSHCGGSLINKRYVITAAHCQVKVPRSWKLTQVRLGEWDANTNPDCQQLRNEQICADPFVEVPVAEIIIHDNYNPDVSHQPNDIALLRLQNNVQYSDYIKPICLPEPSVRGFDFAGLVLEVAGFGKTEYESTSSLKLKVDVDGFSHNDCQNSYSRLPITTSQICAGGESGKDSCNGDSGGPLMRYDQYSNYIAPYYMLVGVVSFGPKNCGTKDVPGVYTKVSEYMDWINSKIVP